MLVNGCSKAKNILIDLRKNARWQHVTSGNKACWAIGYVFSGGDFMKGMAMAWFFLKYADSGFRVQLNMLKCLNGNFAVICKGENAVFIGVDKSRSYPLFYSLKDNNFIVGDDAHSIRDRIKPAPIEPFRARELFMSGYVSGSGTLVEAIKQLQPGEAVHLDLRNERGDKNVIAGRYYMYHNKYKIRISTEKLIDLYDDKLNSTFKRLVQSVNNRKLIVPLSGGMDSRLIVSMLKRIGYENVVCFSYGLPDNWETNLSKKIAATLSYKWIYVPYSRKTWHGIYNDRTWNNFFYSYDNLSSIANIDDWHAVSELKQKRLISEDAVFVPGHTGDFISGGHLQYVFNRDRDVTKDVLIQSILNKHYSLWKRELNNSETMKYLSNKLLGFLEPFSLKTEEDIANAYECWEWHERQSKFIVNSVRSYDFWGYEWRLPFWDSEMMSFWSAVPYELKLGKRLYLLHLKATDSFSLFGNDFKRKQLHRKHFLPGLRKFIDYYRDRKGIYGIHSYFTVSFLNKDRKNINSILVKDYLKRIGFKTP